MTTFDGEAATTQKWYNTNDPVMGGQSVGTFTVDTSAGIGTFDGEVKIVPSLQAPGFVAMHAQNAHFPDISQAEALQLVVRSSIPYEGWKIDFGPAPGRFFGAQYKANFNLSASDDWQTVLVPLNTFSYKWSDTTGEQTVTCADDPSVCPDAEHLKAPTSMEIIAEGTAGKFHLEVKSISAVVNGDALVV